MDINQLAIQIEALLFALGKPFSRSELSKMLEVSTNDIENAITFLLQRASKEDCGVVLIDDGKIVELRAHSGAADIIERVRKDEFSREIGRAGSEIIAILLYSGPSTRSQIDFIRGVNSTQALRTLMMRGLVRRASAASSERGAPYELTTDLLGFLGVVEEKEAPEYETLRKRLLDLRGVEKAS